MRASPMHMRWVRERVRVAHGKNTDSVAVAQERRANLLMVLLRIVPSHQGDEALPFGPHDLSGSMVQVNQEPGVLADRPAIRTVRCG